MSKMRIDIPDWGSVDIENIVIDLNGTIATDGRVPLEVKEKINSLSDRAKVYILTADTQETAKPEPTNTNALNNLTIDRVMIRLSEKMCMPRSHHKGS